MCEDLEEGKESNKGYNYIIIFKIIKKQRNKKRKIFKKNKRITRNKDIGFSNFFKPNTIKN